MTTTLRIAAITFLVLVVPIGALRAQSPPGRTNPGTVCGDESKGLPDFYYESVVERFEPPDWKSSEIKIIVGGEKKLALWTDGEKFKLWAGTPDISQKNIDQFLFELDDLCKLPANPIDAAALIRFKWESKELTPEQFARFHLDLTNALSLYIAKAQTNFKSYMGRKLQTGIYLDASQYNVIYKNGYQHIEARVVGDPKQSEKLLEWVLNLEQFAKRSFHHPIWNREE